MSKKITIQNTYYDALNFATASINEKKDFHLPLSELRLLQKLIHYSSKQANITWSSEQIGNHLFITPTAVDKYVERLNKKGYINVSTLQIAEKVKSRTIFINWEKIEKINKLILEYQIENKIDIKIKSETTQEATQAIPLVVEVEPEIIEEPILLEADEKEITEVEEPKYDMIKIFDSFVRTNLYDLDDLDDAKFDKLVELIDIVKAGLRTGSTSITIKQLKMVYSIIENRTNIFTPEEMFELQEIITNFSPEEIVA
jgi:DNA-binding MarR family transcriptional regulator